MKGIYSVLMVALLSSAGWANNFSEAVAAYEAKNYMLALKKFYPLVQANDPKAQYNVGLFYAHGYGVPKDNAKAKNWYEKAAKQGNAAAQYNLACLYQAEGETEQQAYQKARYWYEEAAKQGIKQAYSNLGSLYIEGLGVPKDSRQALALFEKAAALGDGAGGVNAGMLYAWGEGITHNKRKAFGYLKSAFKLGQPEARHYIVQLCQEDARVCKE